LHLVDEASRSLRRAGVDAVFGWTVGGRRRPGPTWISLVSPKGYGRLIRHGDGSSESSAHRASERSPLLVAQSAITTRAHLDDLIAAIAGPPASEPRRRVEGRADVAVPVAVPVTDLSARGG
jgi:hypothetical protein